MSVQYKLSLPAAVLININIMMGSGIFINMLPVAKKVGLLSAGVYGAIGLLMFPVVYSMAALLRRYPGGSFYTFGSNDINKFFGFLATWVYFIGKLASASLLIHFCTLILQSLIPSFSSVNSLVLDAIIIGGFAYLNMHNLKVGSVAQYAFIFFKAIPILLIILSGIFFLNPGNLSATNMLWEGIPSVIPLIIFAFAGFEAAASLSRHIENPDKNAPLAVLISFSIVVLIYVVMNFLFYGILGADLWQAESYIQAFPLLLNKIFVSPIMQFKFAAILQLFIACSALGGAYGILFSNVWNLYALAENGHILFPYKFSRLNKFGIPFLCICTEAIICLFYLIITQGNNTPLQQIAAFGNLSAFIISALSLLCASVNKKANSFWISLIATINCFVLLMICTQQLISTGGFHFILFLVLLFLGIIIYFYQKSKSAI